MGLNTATLRMWYSIFKYLETATSYVSPESFFCFFLNNTAGNYKYIGRIKKSPHTDQTIEKAK